MSEKELKFFFIIPVPKFLPATKRVTSNPVKSSQNGFRHWESRQAIGIRSNHANPATPLEGENGSMNDQEEANEEENDNDDVETDAKTLRF